MNFISNLPKNWSGIKVNERVIYVNNSEKTVAYHPPFDYDRLNQFLAFYNFDISQEDLRCKLKSAGNPKEVEHEHEQMNVENGFTNESANEKESFLESESKNNTESKHDNEEEEEEEILFGFACSLEDKYETENGTRNSEPGTPMVFIDIDDNEKLNFSFRNQINPIVNEIQNEGGDVEMGEVICSGEIPLSTSSPISFASEFETITIDDPKLIKHLPLGNFVAPRAICLSKLLKEKRENLKHIILPSQVLDYYKKGNDMVDLIKTCQKIKVNGKSCYRYVIRSDYFKDTFQSISDTPSKAKELCALKILKIIYQGNTRWVDLLNNLIMSAKK
jgi:hypothetical protein